MMNGLQAVESWRSYFGEPKGATLGLFNAAYPIGGLVAIPFISFACDGFGRRAGLALGAIICCIGAALQSGAQNLEMFVIARGVLGCGTVFLGASGAPLITEIAHPAHRATATAMFNTTYSLGAIVAAWSTFGTFRIDGSLHGEFHLPSKAFHLLSNFLVYTSFQRAHVGLYPRIEAMKRLKPLLNTTQKGIRPIRWFFSNSTTSKRLLNMNGVWESIPGSRVICSSPVLLEIGSACSFCSGARVSLRYVSTVNTCDIN